MELKLFEGFFADEIESHNQSCEAGRNYPTKSENADERNHENEAADQVGRQGYPVVPQVIAGLDLVKCCPAAQCKVVNVIEEIALHEEINIDEI